MIFDISNLGLWNAINDNKKNWGHCKEHQFSARIPSVVCTVECRQCYRDLCLYTMHIHTMYMSTMGSLFNSCSYLKIISRHHIFFVRFNFFFHFNINIICVVPYFCAISVRYENAIYLCNSWKLVGMKMRHKHDKKYVLYELNRFVWTEQLGRKLYYECALCNDQHRTSIIRWSDEPDGCHWMCHQQRTSLFIALIHKTHIIAKLCVMSFCFETNITWVQRANGIFYSKLN